MIRLIIGLALFLGVHSVRIVADGWRSAMIERLGGNAWKALYSIVALLGLVLIVTGYGEARADPVLLWSPPVWARHLAALLTLVGFILLAAAYVPGNSIKAAVGHPMVAGVKVWAFAHLLATGTLAGAVLFGSFLAWAIVDFLSSRRRDRLSAVVRSGTLPRALLATAVGVVLWAVFAFWLHRLLFGVAPLR